MYLNRTFMFYINDIITFKNMKKVINRIIIIIVFILSDRKNLLFDYLPNLTRQNFSILLLL